MKYTDYEGWSGLDKTIWRLADCEMKITDSKLAHGPGIRNDLAVLG